MGVHGLWDLLAPVGRRVSVETLAGKRLAIDASIWMIQFMKAMRDEKGEMVRNAHLIGFFRRICKLLFLRIKPVFVFDGGTPALKRRTVIARRRQRENAQAKIRKTAEKLLLNHVKAMKLKELAKDIQDQKTSSSSKGKTNSDNLEDDNEKLIDDMLAEKELVSELGDFGSESSRAAEIGSSSGNASTCATAIPDIDEDDEEIILPIMDGDVDPAVLASLPPSMQLDLLVQMRERLIAENRQKYQKVKKAPQKFSELQIEAYLKTVAFRREIDQVQRAASGKGVGGVQTSHIASESNREYIFSSSFSGDKQLLTPGEAENISDKQRTMGKNDSSVNILDIMSSNKHNKEAKSDAEDAVHTFLDERGLKRVSRRRAMGIRMTRDLERNIDLLKELEQDRTTVSTETREHNEGKFSRDGKSCETGNEYNCDVEKSAVNSSLESENNKGTSKRETCIEISFDDDGMHSCLDGDDEFFVHLVAGSQAPISTADNSSLQCDREDGMLCGKSGNSSSAQEDIKDDSEVEWEEGSSLIGDKSNTKSYNGNNLGANSCCAQDEYKDDSDMEWEDGSSLIGDKSNTKPSNEEENTNKGIVAEGQGQSLGTCMKASLLSSGVQKVASKGSAEEEAALQEAMRRSLQDIAGNKLSYAGHVELESGSYSPTASSHLDIVMDEFPQSQLTDDECGKSNIFDGKDTFTPKPFGTPLTSAASSAGGPTPCLATKDHLEQILSTSIESAELGSLECGSNGLTNMDACILSGAAPKIVVDDMINVEAVPASFSRVDEFSFGQTSSALEGQTLHGVFEKTAGNDDNWPVGMPERGHENNTIETLGSSLEDELLLLDQEYKNLGDEQRKLERNADSVNAEMFVECQELLQMFGLPYIIAPMEAEAQCAYMELTNLVDGVVTDDSDVFLFGGQSVYKNIFDDRKYVETYLMKDIVSELGLNREKLIRMALLLGSDYTEGVSGIGIVNAIEVVNAFPEEDGLHKFREWIESPDPTILGKIGVRKKGSKVSKGMNDSKNDVLVENDDNDIMNDTSSIKLAFMNKHRNVSKNWHIPASFPSDAVISAYEAPQVDKSTESFAWGKPDVFSLRRLCWEKFGWASQKADELLLPVLKEYNKHETQLRLEAFYSFNERFAKIRSKRIQKAVKGIIGKQHFDAADDLSENVAKENFEAPTSDIKRKKCLLVKKDNVGEKRNLTKNLKSQQIGNQKDRLSTGVGSKKVRERNRGKAKRVGQKGSSDFETNSSNNTSDELGDDTLDEIADFNYSVRRSKRTRKAVNYVEKDEESVTIPENGTGKFSNDVGDVQNSPHWSNVEVDVTKQALPGDYLIKGGGFCAQDDEVTDDNKLGAVQRDIDSLDAINEYLQIGGGFCVDKGKDDIAYQERDGGGASTISASLDNSENEEFRQILDSSVSVMVQTSVLCRTELAKDADSSLNVNFSDQQHEITRGALSNVELTSDDGAPSSMNPFRAVPYMKRKRKGI